MKFIDALEAARRATNNYISTYGECPLNCGFAWVVVKNSRGKRAQALKDLGFKKRYVGPGLSLWNPSGSMTQDMDAKYAGAEAYAAVLTEMGYQAEAQCRLD